MTRIALTLLLLCFIAAPVALAQKTKPHKGVVQNVDAEVGTITLIVEESVGAKSRRVKTFNLSRPDLPVTNAAGKAFKLADIVPEQRVFFDLAGEDVTAIRLAPPSFYGTVARVNVAERTLSVTSKLGERTFAVPESAKIEVSAGQIPLDGLKPGSLVLVSLADDTKTVLAVRSGKGVAPVAPMTKGVGVLVHVNEERRDFQLVTASSFGDHYLLRELTFAKEPTVALLYHSKPFRDGALAEVRHGVKATFWADATTKKVVHLEIELPILAKRTVKSFDPESGRLVLTDSDGEKRIVVGPQTKIMVGGRFGTAADIKTGIGVSCGLSTDRKTAEVVSVFAK